MLLRCLWYFPEEFFFWVFPSVGVSRGRRNQNGVFGYRRMRHLLRDEEG